MRAPLYYENDTNMDDNQSECSWHMHIYIVQVTLAGTCQRKWPDDTTSKPVIRFSHNSEIIPSQGHLGGASAYVQLGFTSAALQTASLWHGPAWYICSRVAGSSTRFNKTKDNVSY